MVEYQLATQGLRELSACVCLVPHQSMLVGSMAKFREARRRHVELLGVRPCWFEPHVRRGAGQPREAHSGHAQVEALCWAVQVVRCTRMGPRPENMLGRRGHHTIGLEHA